MFEVDQNSIQDSNMVEPLSIATGVVSLLSTSYKFSKDIYELIDSVQSAPKHTRNVSDDLKALYATLGTLDSLFATSKSLAMH